MSQCKCWVPEFGRVKHSDNCIELTELKAAYDELSRCEKIVIAASKLIQNHLPHFCACDLCEAFK